MSAEWGKLPVLPLRCILEHLSLEDALAATSTCRHWRSAVLGYKGHRDTLKLRTKQFDKNTFLTRIFKKYTRNLHIYIDCGEVEFEKFMNDILPQFYDTAMLNEMVFIGPKYLRGSHLSIKLKRVILESLVYKNLHNLKKLELIGCELDTVKNENDRCVNKNVEDSIALSFNDIPSAADLVLSRRNISLMMFSSIQHITLEYELANTESLQTLSQLVNFVSLSLNIGYNRQGTLKPIDWARLSTCYARPLDVSINIITIPVQKFNEIISNVLVEDLKLVSLKVMYCKTFYFALIKHVALLYGSTLSELVWTDCPYDMNERLIKPSSVENDFDSSDINPLILLCWKCEKLRRLVIHGYWIWHYDLIGCARLRKSLEYLEVSSLYGRVDEYCSEVEYRPDIVVRVLVGDSQTHMDRVSIMALNIYSDFDWKPTKWRDLHPGLRARATKEDRSNYALQEMRNLIGFK